MNHSWSMDFVSDQLFDVRRFSALTVVDNYSRKCLGIYPSKSIKGEDVISFMEHTTCLNKAVPDRIQEDNCSECFIGFISKALDKWAYDNKIILDFSRPRKPVVRNRRIICILSGSPQRSFNGSFRGAMQWMNV
ncbi:MAG: DDE-type integrase/transposase/recombinase [Bacteroidota bacterium]